MKLTVTAIFAALVLLNVLIFVSRHPVSLNLPMQAPTAAQPTDHERMQEYQRVLANQEDQLDSLEQRALANCTYGEYPAANEKIVFAQQARIYFLEQHGLATSTHSEKLEAARQIIAFQQSQIDSYSLQEEAAHHLANMIGAGGYVAR